MQIGELCQRVNVSKELIRHYEAKGLIHSTQMAAGSRFYRHFGEDTMQRLQIIRIGKEAGMSLGEIKPLLDAFMDKTLTPNDAFRVLEGQYEKMQQRINDAQRAQQMIAMQMEKLQHKPRFDPACLSKKT